MFIPDVTEEKPYKTVLKPYSEVHHIHYFNLGRRHLRTDINFANGRLTNNVMKSILIASLFDDYFYEP